MATLPRAAIDAYTRDLNALSDAARETVAAMLGQVEYESIADLREQVTAIMEAVCSASSDMAAARAAEFYDEARALQAGVPLGAEAVAMNRSAAIEGAVRALVQIVADGKPFPQFVGSLADRADYEVKRAAGECVKANAARDSLKPKWARVPAGTETCGFCLMLASRGFVYASMESAGDSGHYHPHCDCRIVPGFEGMQVEGYDPDYFYELYSRNLVTNEYGAVDLKATAKAIERYVKNGGYSIKPIAKEADGFLDYSRLSGKQLRSLTDNEKLGHELLKNYGFNVVVLPTDRSAVASIDLLIDGSMWELKTPEKTGGRIRTRINEGVSKWDRLHSAGISLESTPKIVLDNRFCSMRDSDALTILVECMDFHKEKGFDEAIFICKSGRVKQIRR